MSPHLTVLFLLLVASPVHGWEIQIDGSRDQDRARSVVVTAEGDPIAARMRHLRPSDNTL